MSETQPKPKRIAVICLSMAGGGAELATARLVNGLEARGYTVDLLLWRKKGPVLDKLDRSINIVELGGARAFIFLKIARYLRQAKPEAVIGHQTFINVMTAIALILAFNPAPLIATEHNTYTRALQTKRDWIRTVYEMAPVFYRRARFVAAVSSGVADDAHAAIGVPTEKLRVVYNPAVSDRVLEIAGAPVDHDWFRPGEPPVFISVNRLEPQKNPQLLIRAFAKARGHAPMRLVLLGAGALERELRDLAASLEVQDDVFFAGFQTNPYAWISKSHALVLASDFEGFAIVVAEALALGTRVISTDCPFGPAEILRDGRFGILTPVGDVDAMATAILESTQTVDSQGAAAERRARGLDFSETAYLDRYEEMLSVAR